MATGWPELDGDFVSDTFSLSSDGAQVPYADHHGGLLDRWGAERADHRSQLCRRRRPDHHLVQLRLAQRRLQRTLDFGWLLTVEADDANGDALSGATVNVFDNSGSPVFSGVTDASGQLVGIPLVTAIYQQSNTPAASGYYTTITTQNCGPFQVAGLAGGLRNDDPGHQSHAIDHRAIPTLQRHDDHGQRADESFGHGRRFAGEREPVVDRQRRQRHVLHGGAVRTARRATGPSSPAALPHGHQLRRTTT